MLRHSSRRSRQTGYSLPEVLIGVAIASLVWSKTIGPNLVLFSEQIVAGSDANLLGEHNKAIRQLVAQEGVGVVAAIYANTNWLKSTVCPGGLAAEPYLRCDFPEQSEMALTFTTTVTNIAGTVTATTIYGSPYRRPPNLSRPDLAGRVTRIVNGGDISTQTPINQSWFNLSHDINTAVITGVVANTVRIEEWLRRDATVLPTADFDWDGFAIENLSTVQASTFVDREDGTFLIDADTINSRVSGLRVENDIFIESLGEWLTNLVNHHRDIVRQGGFIPEPTCPNGTGGIYGGVVSIAQNSLNPRPMSGFETYALPVPGGWQVFAQAHSGTSFTSPPATVVRIQALTYCS